MGGGQLVASACSHSGAARKYEADPKLAWDILEEGSAKARAVAEATMVEARDAANLSHEYEPPAQGADEGK